MLPIVASHIVNALITGGSLWVAVPFLTGEIRSSGFLSLDSLNDGIDTGDNQYALIAEVETLPPDSPPVTVNPDNAILTVLEDDIAPTITCAPLTEITDGMPISYDESADGSGNYPFGTVATFSCMAGFGLVGASSSTCGGDDSSPTGMFAPAPPACERESHNDTVYCYSCVKSNV